jgi:2-amino-4-hydroxy-6-hydroxymethyldihydropteridine diphosphokinase
MITTLLIPNRIQKFYSLFVVAATLQSIRSLSTATRNGKLTNAYIALGSNLGDRYQFIHDAIKKLSCIGKVKTTSFLYETTPMYHLEQPRFLNAACQLETLLEPHELLRKLKFIEQEIGRKETFRNGPRVIDLDIVLFGKEIVKSVDLEIPHPRLHEREFVLRPLADMIPNFIHPVIKKSFGTLLAEMPLSTTETLYPVVPLGKEYNLPNKNHSRKIVKLKGNVLIAGILNVTPDSFSDGGQYNSLDISLNQALVMLSIGADIIDIGGESTRPGSTAVSVDEELKRVIPVIRYSSKFLYSVCDSRMMYQFFS